MSWWPNLLTPEVIVPFFQWEKSILWLVLGAVTLSLLLRQWYHRSSQSLLPPMAPYGMFETIRKLGTFKAPWFLVEVSRHLQSNVFRLNLPLPGGLYVSGDVKLNREILMDTQSEKLQARYFGFDLVSGDKNIFSSPSNDHWKHVRKGTAPAFSTKEVGRMNEICNNQVDHFIKNILEPAIALNKTFDPTVEFLHLTFRVICEAAFEYTPSEDEVEYCSTNLEIALRYTSRRPNNPLSGLLGLFRPESKQGQLACRKIQAFGLKVLQGYRDNPRKSNCNTVIRLLAENPHMTTDRARVAEIITFIIAGHDTTGHTMGNLFLNLCQHPETQTKLRSELSKVDRASNCSYLRQVIRESDRLMPTAPVISVRKIGRPYVVGEGKYVIPKGASVFVTQMVSNHDETLFPDPERFDPSRWDESVVTPAMLESNMPFSIGMRNCLGQALATSELHTVVPELISKYSFELIDPGHMECFFTIKTMGTRIKASPL